MKKNKKRINEIVNEKIRRYKPLGLDTTVPVVTEEFFERPITGTIPDIENIDEILIDVISREIYQSLGLNALDSLQDKSEDVELGNLENLLCNLPENSTIVTNGNIGTLMQDMNSFNQRDMKLLANESLPIYCVGQLGHPKRNVWINAFMRWDDDRVIVFNENFWNWKLIPHDEEKDMIINETTFQPLFSVGKIYQEIKQTEHFNYNINITEHKYGL